MLLENLLQGMTIPGVVPQERRGSMSKQMSRDLRTLYVIQNLIGEIVRLQIQKLIGKIKGYILDHSVLESVIHIDQSSIAREWGVSRNMFPILISKIQLAGTLQNHNEFMYAKLLLNPIINSHLF